MGLINGIKSFFRFKTAPDGTITLAECEYLMGNLCYKKLAIETCVSLIANVISTCEFQTFYGGKEVKNEMYYLFNVRPNVNQNAGEFFHEFVSRLIKCNEVLVVMKDDELYLADTFNVEEGIFTENIYSDITIKGYTIERKYRESEVLHIRLNNENIKRIIDAMADDYGKLVDAATKIYKRKNTMRVVLKVESLNPQDTETKAALQALFETQFKSWFEADNAGAVLPLQKGMEISDWSSNTTKNTVIDSRDIKHLIDDMYDFISAAFHVPKGILKGDMADISNQIDSLIMFCIKPITELLKDEINGKMYSKKDFLNGNCLKIDTTKIRVVDIVQIANAADRLFAAGVNTINDNLYMLDREKVDEEFADTRFVTKNYQTLQSLGSGVAS